MKQKGNCVTGDPIRLDKYTAGWLSVKLHPTTYYRRLDDIKKGYGSVKGIYAEIDMGHHVVVKFSEKEDLTDFYRIHHKYI
jgi:hypothetical protein